MEITSWLCSLFEGQGSNTQSTAGFLGKKLSCYHSIHHVGHHVGSAPSAWYSDRGDLTTEVSCWRYTWKPWVLRAFHHLRASNVHSWCFFCRMETTLSGKIGSEGGVKKVVTQIWWAFSSPLLRWVCLFFKKYINENYKQPLRCQPTNPILGRHLVETKILDFFNKLLSVIGYVVFWITVYKIISMCECVEINGQKSIGPIINPILQLLPHLMASSLVSWYSWCFPMSPVAQATKSKLPSADGCAYQEAWRSLVQERSWDLYDICWTYTITYHLIIPVSVIL